jgi:ribonucleoside-diphosphate reductase alpha chain
MGLAEFFARIGVAYDSEQALNLGTKIAKFLAAQGWAASAKLGERRGAFPAFHQSVWPRRGFTSLRNATVTCVAPTGTISLIAGATAAIEPFFAPLARRVFGDQVLHEVNPFLKSELEALGAAGEAALAAIGQHGSVRCLENLPEDVRRRFPIAMEIVPKWHVRMQAAFQAHVDAAVSKTINLSADAPLAAVRDAFILARQLRLKGITVYRYGSRAGQTLTLLEHETRSDCRECAV